MQDTSMLSGMLTPLKTSNSDDYSDYYYYLNSVEKHLDSIIPTEQAKKIQCKKSNTESTPSSAIKEPSKQKLKELHIEFSSKITTLVETYTSNKSKLVEKLQASKKKRHTPASPFSALYIPDKSAEIDSKEQEIREKFKKQQELELKKITKQFEEKKTKIIDEKRDSLQKFWRSKMFELNGKLQQAEWKKNLKRNEEEEKVKNAYEKLYKEVLEKEKVLLEDEVDLHFKTQFEEKLKSNKKKKGVSDKGACVKVLREKVEAELNIKYLEEKESWNGMVQVIRDKAEKEVRREETEKLRANEVIAREKAAECNKEILNEKQKQVEKNWNITMNDLKKNQKDRELQNLDTWAEEATSEFKEGLHFEAVYNYKEALKPQLTKEITRSISNNIETQVFNNEQEKVFKSVSEELNSTFDFYKKETENLYKKEHLEIEEHFQEDLLNKVKIDAEKKIAVKEKELYIRYVHKLEKMRSATKKEFEGQSIFELKVTDIQKTRENVLKEKTSLAQFKAKNNIQISRYEEEITVNLQKLEEEAMRLEVKVREVHQRSKLEDEIIFRTVDTMASKSPSKKLFNNSAILRPQILKDVPRSLLPPSLSAKDIRPRNESSCKAGKYCINPSPKNDLNEEFIMKTQARSTTNAKSQSYDSLKLGSKDKLRTSKIKQNMYHELLKQKFGFIQPRLK